MLIRLMMPAILAVLLSGCAYIMNSSYQDFVVTTNNNQDTYNTRCVLSNYRGSWVAEPNTPLIVHRDNNTLEIRCDNLTQTGYAAVQPDFQGLYLIDDILFGLVLSSIFDDYTGAFYQYRPVSALEMIPR